MRDAELVRYLVLAAQREGNRTLAVQLRVLDLTPSQAEVVRILSDHELSRSDTAQTSPGLGLDALGQLLVCESGTNPSRLVDRLVRAGLVERSGGASDLRRVSLSLTERGRQADAAVRRIEQRLYSHLDRALGADAPALVALLRQVTAGMPAALAVEAREALGG